MGGSGKTVLASDSVRHVRDKSWFEQGIFWLNIGNINIKDTATFKQTILNKLEILVEYITILNPNLVKHKFDDLAKIDIFLKKYFELNPKCLLILDDVWSSEVIQHFRFNITVLVTSQIENVVPIEFPNRRHIAMANQSSGDILTMEQSIYLFYTCLKSRLPSFEKEKIDRFEQNDHLKRIIAHFKGLPFCIPLIVNLMYSFYTRPYKVVEKEISFAEEWHELAQLLTEDPNDQLNQLVASSVSVLSEDMQSKLYDFAILNDETPFSVFKTLWGLKGVQTQHVLDQLCDKSLVIRSVSCAVDHYRDNDEPSNFDLSKSCRYSIHSITRKFLETNMSEKERIVGSQSEWNDCNFVFVPETLHQLPGQIFRYIQLSCSWLPFTSQRSSYLHELGSLRLLLATILSVP